MTQSHDPVPRPAEPGRPAEPEMPSAGTPGDSDRAGLPAGVPEQGEPGQQPRRASIRRSHLIRWAVTVTVTVAVAVIGVGLAENVIHLNSLVLLIVVGVIVAELVMYLRRRVRRAQAGAAQAGTTGGPTSPPGTPPRLALRVAVVLMVVYSPFFFLSFLIAAFADEYCSSQRCHVTVGWAGLMLLVTLVLISFTAIAGVLPRRTAGQRIRALVLGYAGPMLALVAYFVAISGQVPL